MRRVAPWLLGAVLLAYPVGTLARGAPSFPTHDECVRPAIADGEIDAVFGYFDSRPEAATVRDHALQVGFAGTEMAVNPCGRVRVAVRGIPTLAVGHAFADEAGAVGFDVTLERASG
jgi:hypothetical protein